MHADNFGYIDRKVRGIRVKLERKGRKSVDHVNRKAKTSLLRSDLVGYRQIDNFWVCHGVIAGVQ
jgi:hypothetical protein